MLSSLLHTEQLLAHTFIPAPVFKGSYCGVCHKGFSGFMKQCLQCSGQWGLCVDAQYYLYSILHALVSVICTLYLTLGAHAHSEGYSSCRVCMYVCVYECMCVCVYV